VGFTFTPRWSDEITPVQAWTNNVVCGLCADDLTVDDFGDTPVMVASNLTGGHPDAVRIEIRLDDISDGYWRDPTNPRTRVKT